MAGVAILLAGSIAIVAAITSAIRSNGNPASAAISNFLAIGIVLFVVDLLALFYGRPMLNWQGLIVLVWFNLLFAFIIAGIIDCIIGSFDEPGIGGSWIVALIGVFVIGFVYLSGHNSGHNAYKASHLVAVNEEPGKRPPASVTTNMVVVPEEVATTKASNAMSSSTAGERNYSSLLDLGPATLQMIDGTMMYAFPLEFQGAINKHRLKDVEPGYILVNAQDPNAEPIERYNGPYSMVVSLGGGQGSEPARWAYSHGYDQYTLDDPTLEIRDDGHPFYTVTLLQPQLGWTFPAPVGLLVIDAHTGQITRYDLPTPGAKNPPPSWVDRVYGADLAKQITNWYGFYRYAPFGGQGNSNRYQVSEDPVMVYTGDGHPSWRMLLTSFGNEQSTWRIVEFDAESGAMQIYKPEFPMGIESTVREAFESGSGVGAQNIKSNHYSAVDLTLHVIYGHLVWMASFITQGNHPSLAGIGFVDAYNVSANNVAFGASKGQALQNLLQQLSNQSNANPGNPGAGGDRITVSGTVANIAWDMQGGTKYYYITLNGPDGKPNWSRVFSGTSELGPAIVEAQIGDHVTMTVLKITTNDSQQTMQSFFDQQHPLQPAGT